MKNVVKLMILSLALFITQQGFAQSIQKGEQMISVNLGAVIPVNSINYYGTDIDYGKTGFGLGAQYQYFFTDTFALGLELDQNWFGQKEQYGVEFEGRASNFLITGRANLVNKDDFRVYLPIGLGVARMREDIDDYHIYDTGFTWNAGLGIETAIPGNPQELNIGLEAKFNQAYWNKDGIDEDLNYLSLMLKLSRRF